VFGASVFGSRRRHDCCNIEVFIQFIQAMDKLSVQFVA
jgi:hypothetical protein